ncbi:MAG: glycoside hydrolase family 15 protein [Pseudonocardiaceae bacterium]
MSTLQPSDDCAQRWAPDLGAARLLGGGRTAAMLRRDAVVQWWCAPDFDDAPLCWQLLDPNGGAAAFSDLTFVDADPAPAGSSARTLLRGTAGIVEVWDGLLDAGSGVALVRLVRPHRASASGGRGQATVEHALRLGGFTGPWVEFHVEGTVAQGGHLLRGRQRPVRVHADAHHVREATLHSTVRLTPNRWTALVVAVDGDVTPDAEALAAQLESLDAAEQGRLKSCRLPRLHPERAADALAVLRACTYRPTGAVVASPTTSLPEAPGYDRQFDYRYTWLRDASVSTAVAALVGQPQDARHYLEMVHRAWGVRDMRDTPVLDVRGGHVPDQRDVPGISGWAGSRPVRVGNAAGDQRQYDALGLLVEAVSVYLQVGGRLDAKSWRLVTRLADGVAHDEPDRVKDSNGIWEFGEPRPLVDGDVGRWMVLDRALWIARGWRPWTRRRRWKTARDIIGDRILASLDDRGLLPQSYRDGDSTPDAAALMTVAFGLLGRDDPRASRLVDALLDRLGAGPYLYRYPADGGGFSGTEGAFLPVSFLAVTALAKLGRVQEARARLDRLCAELPRLLAEEVEPQSGRMRGNTPLVWSHAELARALYVLDAAQLRDTWGAAGLWAWRLYRYLALRHQHRAATTAHQEETMATRPRPAGPPAATIRPGSGGIGRSSSPAAEAVSDALRRGTGNFLQQRRRIALLQTATAAMLGVVGLYQFGLLRSVPEPPLRWLDADRVDASGEAYSLLHTPDSSLGIMSAGMSLVLAGMGGATRYQQQPWIPLALLAKSLLDAAGGLVLTAEQLTKHKRLCSWCTATAALLVATVPVAVPEARAAWRSLRS